MTPNWPHIVATLFVHYPYKTLARASGVDDKHLRKVANSCRDGAGMEFCDGMRLIALYERVTGCDIAEPLCAAWYEWGGEKVASMRPRKHASRCRVHNPEVRQEAALR